jgi:hypothetical protein
MPTGNSSHHAYPIGGGRGRVELVGRVPRPRGICSYNGPRHQAQAMNVEQTHGIGKSGTTVASRGDAPQPDPSWNGEY